MEYNIPEKYTEIIDSYLEGGVSDDALSQLKKEIADQPDLLQAVDGYIEAKANIRILGEKKQKAKFDALFDQEVSVSKSPTATKRFKLGHWLRAASVLVAIGLGSYYMIYIQDRSFDLDSDLQELPTTLQRTDNKDGSRENWNDAIEDYSNQKYTEALNHLDEMQLASSVNHKGKLALFKAICQIRLEDYDEALQNLDQIKKDNPFYDQGMWYTSIIHVKQGNVEKARSGLEAIRSMPAHYRKAEAIKILDEL